MPEKFFIATAIAYASKKQHIGNTYDPVLADAIARYQRLLGKDVYFLTGTDEHGQKIEDYAKEAATNPKAYVDKVVSEIKGIMDLMNTSYDQFIRTTDEKHKLAVQHIFKKLHDQGDIYKDYYEGWYCVPCESFFTETQLVDSKCPDCGRPVTHTKEEAYFFKMSNYQDRLLKHYEDHPGFIQPQSRKAEMVNNFLKPGLQDLCVSRTSFQWGIPVDFDPKHVVYVWIDALANYITALGYDPDLTEQPALFNRYWPCNAHIIGKDILRFHTIYWPILLMALDLPLPETIFGHSWYLSGADKMSKSVGNVLYADELAALFSVDGVRFFLLANMPFGGDGTITYEALLGCYNTDLANTIGNLVSRSIAMTVKYFGGTVQPPAVNTPLEADLKAVAEKAKEKYRASMESFHLADATGAILSLAHRLNKYIDETQPWALAKDPDKTPYLGTVLYHLTEGIRQLGMMLLPIIPDSGEKILQAVQADERSFAAIQGWDEARRNIQLENIQPLFARIDEKILMAAVAEQEAAKAAALPQPEEEREPEAPPIEIDDFAKVALCAAKILLCEPVPKSNKLLRLEVDDGSGVPRQVVSGIATWYAPADLVGKTVVLVKNLKPVKLRGVESQGMILAADVGEDAKVLFLDDAIPPGAKIR